MNRPLVFVTCFATCVLAQWNPNDPPARPNSGMPFLTNGRDGSVLLSWTDPAGDGGHALRFSRWNGSGWSNAETVAQGKRWFVNWADFPAIQVLPDGSMLAHWLERAENAGQYGYGIRIARKGARRNDPWHATAAMNQNDVSDYAGFLSFQGAAAAYLSPPAKRQAHSDKDHNHESGHVKTLRFVRFDRGGGAAEDQQLDDDVCSCCMTATVATGSRLLVAYRDHLPGEIRDISIIQYRNGKWSKPRLLHRDGWKINGCPTEGPSMATSGATVAVAWMTRARDVPQLQLSISRDGGDRFHAPVRVDDGNPLGRPALAAIDARQMLLVWLEKTGEGGADVRLRRIYSDRSAAPSVTIAHVPGSRAAGLPKIALHGRQVLVAWRAGQVRAGWMPLESVPERSAISRPSEPTAADKHREVPR